MAERDSDAEAKTELTSSQKSVRDSTSSVREARKPGKKAGKRKAKGKMGKKVANKTENGEPARTRTLRSFPASTFEEAFILADAIQKFALGQEKVRKLTLFDKLGKSPDSGPSRQL